MKEQTKHTHIGVIGLKGLPAFGGAASVGQNIINSLSENHKFTVYATSSHTSKNYQNTSYKQIVFRRLPLKKFNIFFYYLLSALHSIFVGKYDLIHLHHVDGSYIIPLLKLRYKVITTSHSRPQKNGKWSYPVRKFFKFNEKIMLKKSDILTVVGKPLQQVYQEIATRDIHYIPNGISKVKELSTTLYTNNYLLFSAGRIIPCKGCHVMLKALNKIGLKKEVFIIGDLEQKKKYKKEIQKLGEPLNINYIPLIKDKFQLLQYVQNANLFIFPSFYEAMSMMLLEAASVKTPIIASDIPQNTSVFCNDEVLYFKTGDENDLAQKIQWALDHPKEMKAKAEKAYDKLVSTYTWDKIAQSYDKLYKELLG